MIWTIDQEPRNGIMFDGQSTVRVKNRKGDVGEANVEYSPTVRIVGPVVALDQEDAIDPVILDPRPTFRS